MSFTNLITTAIDSVVDDIISKPNPTVCELGNQRLKNNKARSTLYRRLGKTAQPTTTKEFFIGLGFSRYLAIDVNTDMDAVAMDLNTDISKEYNWTEQFDLVTNNGTGEHVFNQYTVYKNTHDLTKVGGYMIHVLPFYRWVDHGFFNTQPNLYPCLALQNDYDLKGLWIGASNGERIEKVPTEKLRRYKGYRNDFQLDSWERDPMVCAIMKKKVDKPFEIPQQHLYSGENITSDEIGKKYK